MPAGKPSLIAVEQHGYPGMREQEPVSYTHLEDAKLDGASNLRIFTQIVLPLMKPILIFVALSQFITCLLYTSRCV